MPKPIEREAPALLQAGDPDPVGIIEEVAATPLFFICDHAGNAVPRALGDLGLPGEELNRHIAIDLGILPVAQKLADRLGAALVWQRYSRLVVDANRLPSAPDSMAPISDGTVVPGNRALTPAQRQARLAAILEPYHACIATRLAERRQAGRPTVLVAMHSFTPALKARPTERPWHLGLCWGDDDRFSQAVLAALEPDRDLVIGRNQPYSVDMANDYSIPQHAERAGLPYAEFELRQDLLAAPGAAEAWAERLARALSQAVASFFPGRL